MKNDTDGNPLSSKQVKGDEKLVKAMKLNRKAMTLIDLAFLVPCVILITLLLISSSTSREMSLGAACSDNLRKMGAAMKMYASDYDDHLPAFVITHPEYGATPHWDYVVEWIINGYFDQPLGSHPASVKDPAFGRQFNRCPSSETRETYGFNSTYIHFRGRAPFVNVKRWPNNRMAQINPGTMLWADSGTYRILGHSIGDQADTYAMKEDSTGDGIPDTSSERGFLCGVPLRHAEKANALFAGGNVDGVGYDILTDVGKGGPGWMFWGSDHY